jgi:small GTP-binding protein
MGCNGSVSAVQHSSENKKNQNRPSKSLTVKVILLGDSGVGKSALLQRYVTGEAPANDDYITTIGMDFQIISKTVNSVPMTLNICDTCGQERFKAIARQYYRDIHSVLLIYDVTSRASFASIESWVNDLETHTNKELSEITMTLIANKCDLQADRVITGPEGEKLAQKIGAFYIETSVKSRETTNTNLAFETSLLTVTKKRKSSVDMITNEKSSSFYVRSECEVRSSCAS